ncbi:hypothetical protein, variant 3 [Plasmodium yoelii 17X]|uniref:Thioredoxin domain-containing protein n=1 Tax=Plasmodium yoelii 17X TaxID=1323249 RepID=V7PT36_PLAYE|nr:hypothetical protein YYC_01605 [Plasmodium yoelii 17X]ETB61788.1 hypothetical protein, variant 1 [Plasmodium yoelii 17X]ETB61789.1 hypothetical protein, variant 2 [Plasmodium yoelii 17X]ETB61790.1 hypothetical protein, variant 3 [Plasmodium yoelii 17X]
MLKFVKFLFFIVFLIKWEIVVSINILRKETNNSVTANFRKSCKQNDLVKNIRKGYLPYVIGNSEDNNIVNIGRNNKKLKTVKYNYKNPYNRNSHYDHNKRNELKQKKKTFFFICNNLASSTKKKKSKIKRETNIFNNLNYGEEEQPIDHELEESLSGCIENDIKDNYFDSLIGCSDDNYNYDEDNFDKDDLSEETKRKKYYAYGRKFNDQDFNSEHVNKYYQYLPIYNNNDNCGNNNIRRNSNNTGTMENFRKVYESNKIENLERNIREEDLQYPSVPVNWKVYVCLFFDKKYNYENDEEKKIYNKFNINIRHKFALEFLAWARLSTRIYQNTSKVLMLFNLKKNNNIFGNLIFFTSLNLHYAKMFMESNPYIKLGLCEELYLYSYENNNDHFLIGNFPNLFLQKNYLLVKFFNQNKLKDINELYEKHMRFYITSSMIFKLGTLKKVPKDNLKDLFLSTYQYLPITDKQTKNILNKFHEEYKIFDKCKSVEIDKNDLTIKDIKYEENNLNGKDGNCVGVDTSGDTSDDTSGDTPFEKFGSNCLAELSIINCKDEEEAREFLEKDPYTRCCFFDSIFLSEIREVAPHLKYSEGYMPKPQSYLNYKYKIDTKLNPSESMEDKPDFLENKSLSEKPLKDHEKVDFDILDTFIKLKYTNKDILCSKEESNEEIRIEKKSNNNRNTFNYNINEEKGNKKKYKIKIVDYSNEYIDYICNVERNKILYTKKKDKIKENLKNKYNNQNSNIYDILDYDKKDININKKKDIILIDNTLQFFDHIFFKDYLSDFVYISLPPGEFIEDAYTIKDEKNYDFTIFNTSLATQDDFLKRQNYLPKFLKGIWLKKENSKILFYDKQNNALLFGTGIDKTFSWNKKVEPRIMKRALINMEIAIEKIRKGSSIIHDDITIHQESERIIKEYTDEYTSLENRFTSIYNQLTDSEGYKDLKPAPGLEYLNPNIWEKTPEEHKQLMMDPEKVQKIHSNFLKKLELYKVTIDDDPFVQKEPSESEILSNSDKVDVDIL